MSDVEKTKKRIAIDSSKVDVLARTLETSENEKLNFYKSILGGIEIKVKPTYADTTYVRH